MKRSMIVAVVLLSCLGVSLAKEQQQCNKIPKNPIDLLDIDQKCFQQMSSQVQEQLNTAMEYIAKGAQYFGGSVNTPHVAKMFFDASNEEREHIMKFASFMLMRGGLTNKVDNLINRAIMPHINEWKVGIDALKNALNVADLKITKKISSVISEHEDKDHVNGEFFDGQKELSGKLAILSNLEKMMNKQGALGEFLFQKNPMD